jgi:hypothetical protein
MPDNNRRTFEIACDSHGPDCECIVATVTVELLCDDPGNLGAIEAALYHCYDRVANEIVGLTSD